MYIIFTDSESVVETFQDPIFPYVVGALNIVHKYEHYEKTITECWIPSHVSISRNEQADQDAKKRL